MQVGLKGRYKINVFNQDHELKETLKFKNLLTGAVLDDLMALGHNSSNKQFFNRVAIGSGTVTPTPSDTALGSRVGSVYATFGTWSDTVLTASPYTRTNVAKARFSPGQATGNLTEIGVFDGNTTPRLSSRSLIKDSNGNPTSITVTATDYLDVYYYIDVTPPLDDVISQFTYKGETYTATTRATGVSTYNQWVNLDAATWSFYIQLYKSNDLANPSPMPAIFSTGVPANSTQILLFVSNSTNGALVGLGSYVYGSLTRNLIINIPSSPGRVTYIFDFVKFKYGLFNFTIKLDKPIVVTDLETFTMTLASSVARA